MAVSIWLVMALKELEMLVVEFSMTPVVSSTRPRSTSSSERRRRMVSLDRSSSR